jgi:hypothetical protein
VYIVMCIGVITANRQTAAVCEGTVAVSVCAAAYNSITHPRIAFWLNAYPLFPCNRSRCMFVTFDARCTVQQQCALWSVVCCVTSIHMHKCICVMGQRCTVHRIYEHLELCCCQKHCCYCYYCYCCCYCCTCPCNM